MANPAADEISKIINKQIHANELKLRILMTDGCNKIPRCSACLNDFQPIPANGQIQFINPDLAKIAINQYADSFKGKYPLQVYFSGGEPTMHPDLVNLMKFAQSLDCRVTLITNGIFPDSLELPLTLFSNAIHFGTYEKSQRHAKRANKMGGLIQCVYPYIDESFIKFYSLYNLPIKVFQDFYDTSDNYIAFAKEMTEKFPYANLSFRHTGIQENRGSGCNGCEKICCTLKAAWIFPDSGTSPCPQLYKHPKCYPKTSDEWLKYFEEVELFHRINKKFQI